MASHPNDAITAEERAMRFAEEYGNDIDGASTLGDLVIGAGRLLADILPRDLANAGMAMMLSSYLSPHDDDGEPFDLPEEWAEALEQTGFQDCYSEWPMGAVLHDIAAYALYGILLTGSRDEAGREAWLKATIERAEALYARAPTALWLGSEDRAYPSELDRLMTLVRGRWALDTLQPITPAALAHFGGVSEARIRNLMSGKGRLFAAIDGLIPANEALKWLETRTSFFPSIWRSQDLDGYTDTPAAVVDQDETIWFVPVARDGSVFSPGLARGETFSIGAKGQEQHIACFEDALNMLHRMRPPYWRRPNSMGNWGIVRGIGWARLTATELDQYAANPDLRLHPPPSEA